MTSKFKLKQFAPAERDVLASVLQYLRIDRRVAWAERFNVGAAHVPSGAGPFDKPRYVRFAFKGCSDVLGQLIDGRLLAIETKTFSGRTSPEQRAFLERVNAFGGVGILARSLDDVICAMDAAFASEGQQKGYGRPYTPNLCTTQHDPQTTA